MSANGSNNFLNIEDANLRVRSGSVHAQGMTIGGITVGTAHGLQSVTDTSNTTSNTLQFTNATTAFKATSNIELTSATKIIVDSNVVTEYTGPHDRPLRKYPEVALTQNDESATSGYVASGSSRHSASYEYYEAFDLKTNLTDNNTANTGLYGAWLSSDSRFDSNGDADLTTSNTFPGTSYRGEYCALKLPKAIKLDNFHIFPRGDASSYANSNPPKDLRIFGSNDGTTWTHIKQFQNLGFTGRSGLRLHVNDSNTYNEYAFFVEKITVSSGGVGYCAIGGIELYGYEEGSGSLDTTLKTVYNVPATTGTQLELYFDGQDYSDVPSQILDKSGNNLNSTAVGSSVEFNSDYKAFHFPGTPNDATSQATFTLSNPTGAWIHSTAFWLRSSDWNGANIFRAGVYNWDNSGGNNTRLHIVATTDNEIRLDFFGNNVYYGDNGGRIKFAENEWYHLAYTYNGTKISEGAVLYVNGKAVDINLDDVMDRNALNISSNAPLIFDAANVDIGNFRMYNKVLNADQVKELYDFQKDYFLGSKSQVTLYKGHLGAGVTEPSGQLELAGDERIQEYPPRPLTNNDTYIDGHGVFRAYGTNESGTWPEYQAFDDTTSPWYSDSLGEYNNRDYTGTKQLAPETSKGAFIVLEMPYEIVIKQTAFTQQTNGAHVWDRGVYYAKCNPSDKWTAIHNVTDRPANDTTPYVAYITDSRPYKYFAIVITRRYATTASSEGVSIQNFRIFGTPGPTTIDKGSMSLTRSLDVPRISRYDVDAETPRPEKLVLDFDTTFKACAEYEATDISGRQNHGLYNGDAHYSYRERAFKFDGSGDYIEIPEFSPAPDGEWIHTISMWIHITPANTGGRIIEVSADSSTSRTLPHLAWGNGTVRWDMYSSACTFSETFETDRWYHVVLQYKGGNLGKNTVLLWKDGVLDADRTYSGDQTAPLAVASSDRVRFMENVSGMISNIKIYNVVLEPSEVQKLYRLGRTGRSMVISDTAVGIGKNPDAQLDVRGTLRTSNMMVDGESITFKNNNKGGTTNDGDDFAASALLNDYSAWTSIFSKLWIGNGQGWGTFWAGNNGALYRRVATDTNPNEYVFVGGGSKRFTFDLDNGNAYFDGSSSAPGYDYAEYFEWEDGNPDNEDRRGYSVVLCEDGKIKKATSDDEPADVFGIVSGTSGIIGDAACYDWQGKYEVDEWGTKVTDEVYQLSWVTEDGVKHSYDDDRVPEGVTVPENVSRRLYHRERITPDYDNTKDYIPRDKRKEWCPVGLLGKVRLRDGCPTNPNWLFLKTIKGKELWLIR